MKEFYLKLLLMLFMIMQINAEEKVGKKVVFLQKVRDENHEWIFKEDGEIFGCGDEGEVLKFEGNKYKIKSKVPLDKDDYQNDTFWVIPMYVGDGRHH